VPASSQSQTLVDVLCGLSKKYSQSQLTQFVEEGLVRVDEELCLDPDAAVARDSFVEVLAVNRHAHCQTDRQTQSENTNININSNRSMTGRSTYETMTLI
jgi:RNA-binding protein YlmH